LLPKTFDYNNAFIFFLNFSLKKELPLNQKFWLRNIEFIFFFILYIIIYIISYILSIVFNRYYYYFFYIIRHFNSLVISLWSLLELNLSVTDTFEDLTIIIVWFKWRAFLRKKLALEYKIYDYFKFIAFDDNNYLYYLLLNFSKEYKKTFDFRKLTFKKRFESHLRILDLAAFFNSAIGWLFLDSMARKYNRQQSVFSQIFYFMFNIIFFSFFRMIFTLLKRENVTKMFTYENLSKKKYIFFKFFEMSNRQLGHKLNLLGLEEVLFLNNFNDLKFLRLILYKFSSFFYYNFAT
jgi:hypothetical protein